MWRQGVDWVTVYHDRDKCHTVANMGMNYRLHKMWVIYCPAMELLCSQEGFYTMELVKYRIFLNLIRTQFLVIS
jgi:hypothetical protein